MVACNYIICSIFFTFFFFNKSTVLQHAKVCHQRLMKHASWKKLIQQNTATHLKFLCFMICERERFYTKWHTNTACCHGTKQTILILIELSF